MTQTNKDHRQGVHYAYLAGKAVGLILPLRQVLLLSSGMSSWGVLFVESFFGLFLLLPWRSIVEKTKGTGSLIVFTVTTGVFIFYLVINTLLRIITMIEVGLRPGVPAFEGVLVFLILMQVPVLVFIRRPELLD